MRGLSLLELVIAVVLLGIVAALAVPRFSRADPPSADPGLRENLALLRSAIELYYYEHGAWPGQRGDGENPPGSRGAFAQQLTQFSAPDGQVSPVRTEMCCLGPYLRGGIPPCPVPPCAGCSEVALVTGEPAFQPGADRVGWVYNPQTGAIAANSDQRGPDELPYDRY